MFLYINADVNNIWIVYNQVNIKPKDTEGVIKSCKLKNRQCDKMKKDKKTKKTTMISKTLHRKLKIEQANSTKIQR
jgi:hypothetical protein